MVGKLNPWEGRSKGCFGPLKWAVTHIKNFKITKFKFFVLSQLV